MSANVGRFVETCLLDEPRSGANVARNRGLRAVTDRIRHLTGIRVDPLQHGIAIAEHELVFLTGLGALDSLSAEAKRYLPPLPIAFQSTEQSAEMFAAMA